VNSGRGISLGVDLRDDEMPLSGIALVTGQRTLADGDGLRRLSIRDATALSEAELK
jgi:hypothetical protein